MSGFYDDIRLAFHAIWNRRWFALTVAWALALLGWLVVSQMPDRYQSKARVYVQMGSMLPSSIGITAQDQQNNIDTIRQTLTSAVNMEQVIRGTDLANTVGSAREFSDRVAELQSTIKIVAQQNNLFEITATASSPKLASQIVQRLISIFVDQNRANTRNDTQSTLVFLDGQVDQLQRRLSDADAKRLQFQNQYLGSLPGTGSLQERMSAARTQMAQIDGDLAAAQTALASITGQITGQAPTVVGTGGTPTQAGPGRARLNAIEGQLADARARGYTDNHPDVIALKNQLVAARVAAEREPIGGSGGAGIQPNPAYVSLKSMQVDKQSQVAALVARKQQLQQGINDITAKLNGDPRVATEQSQIDRDYQVVKDKYDKVLGDREDVRVRAQAQAQTAGIQFRVIDPPTASRKPASPNRPLLLAAVLMTAIGIGIGAAFGLSQIRLTFATAGRLEKATGLPVIGSISERISQSEAAGRRRNLKLFGTASAGLVLAFVGLVAVEMLMRGLAA